MIHALESISVPSANSSSNQINNKSGNVNPNVITSNHANSVTASDLLHNIQEKVYI